MPIVTNYDPNRHLETVEAILEEWLGDFYPESTYTVTFTPPGAPTKPTIWLQMMPGRNRRRFERDGTGKTVQGKELVFAVSLIAQDRETARSMTQTFERHAVLGSASALGAKGLRYVEVRPFQEYREESQPQAFRRMSTLSFTVEISR